MDCNVIKQANEYASQMAGEYLKELGTQNLNNLTYEQWMELVDIITKNYELEKIRLTPCPF
jgi:hypothetical protein